MNTIKSWFQNRFPFSVQFRIELEVHVNTSRIPATFAHVATRVIFIGSLRVTPRWQRVQEHLPVICGMLGIHSGGWKKSRYWVRDWGIAGMFSNSVYVLATCSSARRHSWPRLALHKKGACNNGHGKHQDWFLHFLRVHGGVNVISATGWTVNIFHPAAGKSRTHRCLRWGRRLTLVAVTRCSFATLLDDVIKAQNNNSEWCPCFSTGASVVGRCKQNGSFGRYRSISVSEMSNWTVCVIIIFFIHMSTKYPAIIIIIKNFIYARWMFIYRTTFPSLYSFTIMKMHEKKNWFKLSVHRMRLHWLEVLEKVQNFSTSVDLQVNPVSCHLVPSCRGKWHTDGGMILLIARWISQTQTAISSYASSLLSGGFGTGPRYARCLCRFTLAAASPPLPHPSTPPPPVLQWCAAGSLVCASISFNADRRPPALKWTRCWY